MHAPLQKAHFGLIQFYKRNLSESKQSPKNLLAPNVEPIFWKWNGHTGHYFESEKLNFEKIALVENDPLGQNYILKS